MLETKKYKKYREIRKSKYVVKCTTRLKVRSKKMRKQNKIKLFEDQTIGRKMIKILPY